MLLLATILSIKVMETKIKALSIKDYLDEIKPYLSDIINDHKTQGFKIHLIMVFLKKLFFFNRFWRKSFHV